MSQDKLHVCEQLLLLQKFYPQFKRVFSNALEEIEEMEVMVSGSPMRRIFQAINEGFQTESDIARRTGLDIIEVRALLVQMVEAGSLEAVPQGGKTDGARGARKMLYVRTSAARANA